jgi:hypothetical protein
MSRLARRNRRLLAAAALVAWMLSLFVGIANACSWDGVTPGSHHAVATPHSHGADESIYSPPDCDEFCNNDVPLVGVLKLVQDQPPGQPIVLHSRYNFGVLPSFVHALRFAQHAHPPPGVPFLLRTVRLTL